MDSLLVDSVYHLTKEQIQIQALSDSLASMQMTLQQTNSTMLKHTELIANSFFWTSNIWMLIATFLVFFMHAGFATLESGLTRSKNTTDALFKSTIIPGIGIMTHALCGFGFMYPGFLPGNMDFIGFAGFWVNLPEGGGTTAYNPNYTFWTDFLYQAMFATISTTIVSGAIAERAKLVSFMLFAAIYSAFIYTIIGSWTWGKGWLFTLGFHDFAGSTLVHTMGGAASLAYILLLGSRLGKFEKGRTYPIPGHNMTSATIGTFILWLGWYGFNGGSVFSADPAIVSSVFMSTTIAPAAGALTSTLTIYLISKNFDLSMTLNGILAGLVAITAGSDLMNPLESVIIGGVAGVIAVYGVILFDKLKIDDPIGALSVHMLNGIWGSIAVGIFGTMASSNQFVVQLIGNTTCGVIGFILSFIVVFLIKITIGIRVTKEEEIYGLDVSEHGMEAYPNFLNR
jgi:ammonium transporter, Amt family